MTLKEMEETSGVIREIRGHIASRGLPNVPDPGVDVPVLQHDVSGIGTTKLMEYMSIFDALTTHANFLASMADSLHTSREVKYKLTRARKYLAAKEMSLTRMTVAELDATMECDSELVSIKHEVVLAEGYKKMVTAMAKGFESKGKLLSRELTRRTNIVD